MSTSTPNFNLTKPAGSENVDISTINSNMDKLDAGVEPIHATQTVTGTNGSITISNALDAPLLNFTATGMGTPSAVVIPDAIGAAMGQQDWDHPMILDVPLGVVRDMGDFFSSVLSPAFVAYGGGVGSNSYDAASGSETGTTVYINSRNFAKLIKAIDISGAGNVSDDGEIDGLTAYLFEIPLPFSVAENSVVYCSHFKNQNISGEEGIWASGSTLYIRSAAGHLDDEFGKLSDQMVKLLGKINYYTPMGPKGYTAQNFCDFFVCLTAATSYTMERDPVAVKTFNGTYTYDWLKISDYLQLFFGDGEELPTLTPLTSISATYYTDIAVNRNLMNTLNAVLIEKLNTATVGEGAFASTGGGAVGNGAYTDYGGAVGSSARALEGGGAVGNEAYTDSGGAVGSSARALEGGGAVGQEAYEQEGGGAIGREAVATGGGGAVGRNAKTGRGGCAIGYHAQCVDSNTDPIDAIQLGTGANSTVKSMQVYGTQLLYYDSTNNTHYIPLSLITASYNAATASEKNDFDLALGNIVRYSITNDLIGAGIGTFVKLTSNGTVSEAWEDGDVFIGQLAEVPSSGANTALVRIKGVMETEAMLGLGLQRVAFSDGTLDISANGREIFVTSSINGRVTFIV